MRLIVYLKPIIDMKNLLIVAILFLSFQQTSLAKEPKLKKIFTGKNFDGWKLPEDLTCWRAEKGILYVRNNAARKGSNLWTEKTYTNFIFQADYLLGDGVVDSGVWMRSENDQIQIGISGSLKRDLTGSPYIPKLRYPVEAKGVFELIKPTDWNTMKIKMEGKTYTVWLNGVEVMTYTSETIPASGPVGLQLHPGNTMSIQYRNIRLAELP